jgi:hypothetical protein
MGVFWIRRQMQWHRRETHRREYPSGAITLLVTTIAAWGPIDLGPEPGLEKTPETAARRKRKRRS